MPTSLIGDFKQGQRNLANIAAQVIHCIYDELKIKPTNVSHQSGDILTEIKDETDGDEILGQARKELDQLFDSLDSKKLTTELQFQLIAEKTIEIQRGNCNELSYLFFELSKALYLDTSLELLMTDSHMFAVVGRNRKSNLQNPTSWGENCIIADPWAKRIMTPLAFQQYRFNAKMDPVYTEHVKGRFELYYANHPNPTLSNKSRFKPY
ncbi:MAG: hypothetical protein ACD_45C00428G0001 [uncultured bacterium]|nr:MAG: hypothetical protein ACD_45C00428G0001 [uncultured bacterium]